MIKLGAKLRFSSRYWYDELQRNIDDDIIMSRGGNFMGYRRNDLPGGEISDFLRVALRRKYIVGEDIVSFR